MENITKRISILEDNINKIFREYGYHICSCIDMIKDMMSSNYISSIKCATDIGEDIEFENDVYGIIAQNDIEDCHIVGIEYDVENDDLSVEVNVNGEYDTWYELDNSIFISLDTYYNLTMNIYYYINKLNKIKE
jgi:hypothetical protein